MSSPAPEYSAQIRREEGGYTVSLIRLERGELISEYNVESEDVAVSHLFHLIAKMGIAPKTMQIGISKHIDL